MTLDQLLIGSFSKYQKNIAIRARGQEISYDELSQHVDHLAGFLQNSFHLGKHSRVVILIEKSPLTVIAALSALRIGAIFIPIDPNLPAQRKEQLILQAQADLTLTDKKWESENAGKTCTLSMDFITTLPMSGLAPVDLNPEDLAYGFFTSGSTGSPKLVEISHRAGLAFAKWGHEEFQLNSGDRISAYSGFHFDLSTFDLFCSLISGATMTILPNGLGTFPSQLAQIIETEKVTVFYCVPTTLTNLAFHGKLQERSLKVLRVVLCAGDVFPRNAWEKMKRLCSARFFNLYGPTETNVCTSYEVKEPIEGMQPISIGKPIPGTFVKIAHEDGSLCNRGEVGFLWISGPTLMSGYFRDRSGLGSLPGAPNTPAYNTGDLAFESGDGLLHFVGRKDSLVKISGYRVSLLEIESALKKSRSVADAIVLEIPDERSGNALAAAVVFRQPSLPNIEALQQELSDIFPSYMQPRHWKVLDKLPLNSNGKVDREIVRKEISK